MKKMTILVALLLCLGLVMPGLAETGTAVAAYESEEYGVSFEYPETWMEISMDTFSDEKTREQLQATLGLSDEMIEMALSSAAVTLYAVDMEAKGVGPNLNMVVSDGAGLTVEMLTDDASIAGIKSMVEQQLGAMVSDFEWLVEPEALTFGDNLSLAYAMRYTMGQIEADNVQVMMVANDMLYTFTFTANQGDLDDAVMETLEAIFESITFA